MKSRTTYLATGLFALALAGAAHAQTPIRITGSTAFRGATVTAISKIFDNNTFTVGFTGSSFTGATAANFRGTVNGTDVLIKTSWSGSEAGIQTVSFGAAPLTVKFLPDNATTTAGTPGTGGGTSGLPDPTAAGNANSPEIPDIAMSDTFQQSSEFFGDFKSKTYTGLTESSNSPVGVVAFKFVASKSAPNTVTNITTQLAQNLFSAGRVQQSLFTGNANDTTFVFATGRDPDSGTRLTTFAEIGAGATASVKQYQPSDGNGTALTTAGASVTNNIPWPAITVNTIPIAVFNGGYSSGGKLALALGNDTTAMVNKDANGTQLAGAAGTGGFYIAYLSTGDAATAVTNGAHELAYNGVTYSTTNLTLGEYTFWAYEHLYYRAAAVGTAVQTVGDKLANQILTTDAPVKISDMKVARTTDGAKVQ